jgi:aminomethyltransferase
MSQNLQNTPFTECHRIAGAKLVAFAGYEMPVSFAGGLAEHNHVRGGGVGLFDVSHMGQITLSGGNPSRDFERLVPSNIQDLPMNHAKYTVLMNSDGGMIDDCIVTKNPDGSLFLVVNGSRKHDVLEHLTTELKNTDVTYHENYGLLALQGAGAVSLLSSNVPRVHELKFMQSGQFQIEGFDVRISRTGYTGEDGFEISVSNKNALAFYNFLMKYKTIQPIGLGARDTLRLEAGLCLYGNDIDRNTSPVEANLNWIIDKERTENLGYIGANIIKEQLENGVSRKRVGLLPQTKAPIRAGVELFDSSDNKIGIVTSGTFSPTLERPIAMSYVTPEFSKLNTEIFAELRGKKIPVLVAKLPFVKHGYVK